ncbi:hypothetical protein [Bacillus pseudomycoides]|uniref:hypothetical protein n=2 Tax=Bacillus pseudomycoides TaxID=64104 RepID=UPI00211D7CE6|nr:hypothetical protein [Bacillus pseudomycoides]
MRVFIYIALIACTCMLISSLILQKKFLYKKYDVFLSTIMIGVCITLMLYGFYGVDISIGRPLWYVAVFILIGVVTGTLISLAVKLGRQQDRYKFHVFGHMLGFLGCGIQIIAYFYEEYQWRFFNMELFISFFLILLTTLSVCIAVFFHRIFFMCVAIFPSLLTTQHLSMFWIIVSNSLFVMGALLMTTEYKKKRRVDKRVEYFKGKGYS